MDIKIVEVVPTSKHRIRVDVRDCPSCGQNHLCMGFSPVIDGDRFALPFAGRCPTKDTLVFMRFVADDTAKVPIQSADNPDEAPVSTTVRGEVVEAPEGAPTEIPAV